MIDNWEFVYYVARARENIEFNSIYEWKLMENEEWKMYMYWVI